MSNLKEDRSIDPEYEWSIIRLHQWWTLLVNEDQRYLGASLVWLRRPGEMQNITELTHKEWVELHIIMKVWTRALSKIWEPDHFNYAWLGNNIKKHGGHGHMHLIPRYRSPREFEGELFTDGRFKEGREYNFDPHVSRIIEKDLSRKIADRIERELSVV